MHGFTRHLRSHQSVRYVRQWASTRHASTLVVAEHDNTNLSSSTLSAVSAAGMIKGDVTVLVLGHKADGVAQQVMK